MRKILIVEDELIVRSIYRRKFELAGYEVETAEEGTAALALLGKFKPDVVQVDIMLPGMDGVEVIRQIRAWPDFKTTPILVISSFYRPDLAKDAWKAGATKCVSKMDCTPNLALELVEQMLSGEGGASPFAKLGMTTIPNEEIRLIPAESPWEEATQIITRKPTPGPGAPVAPPVTTNAPAPPAKPTATLPTFAREALAASAPAPEQPKPAPTTPSFAREGNTISFNRAALDAATSVGNGTQQFNKADFGGTRQFTKPDPEGTKMTTRPSFAAPAAQRLAMPPTAPKLSSTPAAPQPTPSPIAPEPVPDVATEPETPPMEDPWMHAPDVHPEQENTTFRSEIRQEFLKRAPQIQSDLRERVQALMRSKSPTEQITLMQDLEHSVESLASLSGITGFSRISHLSGALDELIKDLNKKPAQMTGSVLRTVAHAADCLNSLFRELERSPKEIPQSTLILAVDDEPISRRTISVALGKANLRCVTMEDPRSALAMLKENTFDLIFLDAEMPELNGFQLCTELRKLPTNKTTPVIFVTSLTKFEVRAQSSLAGGNDLIAKPFLMMELAVKALTYLLRPQTLADNKTPAKTIST